ncbi:MAG: acyl dehydratase [Paraglaciecola sp.]|jgi:acyl dehydratase
MLLKAVFKKNSFDSKANADIALPQHTFSYNECVINENACKGYHQIVGWDPNSEFIHPCYLHSVAFPLHIKLLLIPEFLFPLLGLVHVKNQICQLRPIRKYEMLSVTCCFGELKLHPKGWLFSIRVEFYSSSELVWKSISTNLFRTNHGHIVEKIHECTVGTASDTTHLPWRLSSKLGRRYAKASGDFNPIHLTKWSAKLFGFKQHIIHGMWSKSYCISTLQKINPSLFMQAFAVETTFKQPLYLPNKVNMAVQSFESDSAQAEQHFKVEGIMANNQQPPQHLIGSIRPI